MPKPVRAASARPAVELTAEEARRIGLRAQGLVGAGGRSGRDRVGAMLARLGAVQLDTISVLARSHELVAYARLGPIGRPAIDAAYWESGRAFEYWAHAACVLPVDEWPTFAFRRRHYRRRGLRWHRVPKRILRGILDRLRRDGPLTTKDLGGAKVSSEWWQWSDQKIAIEWLLDIGEVVCVRRIGWRRVYDLPERAIQPTLLAREPRDAECVARLVALAGRALGVATRADLADYYRLRREEVDGALEAAGLSPVTVAGWPDAWADPAALAEPVRGRHAITLLSPFDSLVWDRKRTSRVFGFDHRLEAYTPRDKRVHGYFAMPLLAGGRIVARVDPAREDGILVARRVTFEPHAIGTPARAEAAVTALRTALWQAAAWVGHKDVRVESVEPARLEREVARAVRLTLADIR
jgi:uncharacterized protein